MLVYYNTPDNFRFGLYTFAITEEMKNNPVAGNVSTYSILNFIKAGYYQTLKEKLVTLQQQESVELAFDEFGTFCFIIDFTATCLSSTVFYTRLEVIHGANPFDRSISFKEFSDFYLKYSDTFMNSIKNMCPTHPGVKEIFEKISAWNRSDRGF
jgi:hypothetical protein